VEKHCSPLLAEEESVRNILKLLMMLKGYQDFSCRNLASVVDENITKI
jgi:hypothetical protein